jgi:hypothetical protein
MRYLQAYYSLVLAARMKQGQRVMIHAGWTNIGQAAIALAVDCGCTVFTTVANQEQRAFIRCRFPQVSVICSLVITGHCERCPALLSLSLCICLPIRESKGMFLTQVLAS